MKRKIYKFCVVGLSTFMMLNTAFPLKVYANAYQYDFDSEYEENQFAKETSSNELHDNTLYDNTRNNKDLSLAPPVYGIFSGEFDTDQISPYHSPNQTDSISLYPVVTVSENGEFMENTSTIDNTNYNSQNNLEMDFQNYKTKVSLASDGSIGSLSFNDFNKTVKVFPNTSNESMRKGAGHFTETSEWDGNVSVSGHNRGDYAYFSHLKDMKAGDTLRYKTSEGIRTYKVTIVKQVEETNHSLLNATTLNTLTMVTCVANKPSLRLIVQAEEIR